MNIEDILLLEGDDADPMPLALIVWNVGNRALGYNDLRLANQDELRRVTIETITTLLASGLFNVGDCDVRVGEFEPWNVDHDAAVRRIESEWIEKGTRPKLWDICWFRITPKGEEVAQRLRSQGDSRQIDRM